MPQPVFSQYGPDGKSVYDPNALPYKQPFILAQSAVPVFLLSSAINISATGLITGLTSIPYIPVGIVQVYCFAQTGLAAGLYYANFNGSQTSCQLYLDAAGTITPTGITAGAYAGGTALVPLASVNIPGGIIGPNGSLRIKRAGFCPNNANNRASEVWYNNTSIHQHNPTNSSFSIIHHTHNRNSLAKQYSTRYNISEGVGGNSFSGHITTVDTSVSGTISFYCGNTFSAADFMSLEAYCIEVLPG